MDRCKLRPEPSKSADLPAWARQAGASPGKRSTVAQAASAAARWLCAHPEISGGMRGHGTHKERGERGVSPPTRKKPNGLGGCDLSGAHLLPDQPGAAKRAALQPAGTRQPEKGVLAPLPRAANSTSRPRPDASARQVAQTLPVGRRSTSDNPPDDGADGPGDQRNKPIPCAPRGPVLPWRQKPPECDRRMSMVGWPPTLRMTSSPMKAD